MAKKEAGNAAAFSYVYNLLFNGHNLSRTVSRDSLPRPVAIGTGHPYH